MASINLISTTTDVNIPNAASWAVTPFTVTTAGTPVQGSNTPVPSKQIAVQNSMANANNTLIYVANSSANTAIPTARIRLARGESMNLAIDNLDLLWFDASSNGAVALVVSEV